jgi:GAF domain-containing protein/sugar diacid utilization regulator
LAALDLTKISSSALAAEIRDEAVHLLKADRAIVWRYRPRLRRLFAEQVGEELRTLEISPREARDVMREAAAWARQVVGIRRRLVEASFGVASGSDTEPTLAIPLQTEAPNGLLLVRLGEGRSAGQLLAVAAPFASQATTLLANHDALEAAQRNEAQLTALYETASEISSKLELETVLSAIVERARTLAGAPTAYLMLVDEGADEISMRVTSGITSRTFTGIRLHLGAGLGGMVAQEEQPFYTSDYLNDARFTHQAIVDDEVRREGIKSILGVPLKAFETFVGVLYVADRTLRAFTQAEIDVLMSLAHHAALAIENARLYERATRALAELEQANLVIQEHVNELERAGQVHRQLSEILLAGEGLSGAVKLMSELVAEPVVVLDEHARPLAAAGSPADPFGQQLATRGLDEPALNDGDVRAALAGLGELAPSELPARPPVRKRARLVDPIVAGAELLGSVWVEIRPEAAEEARYLIEQAVRVVGLELLKERSILEAERRMRHELLDGLLTARASNDSMVTRRAAALGVDLGVSYRLVVTSVLPPVGSGRSPVGAVERAKERLVSMLRTQSWCVFAGESAGRVVALVGLDASGLDDGLRRLLAEASGSHVEVRAVVSSPCAVPADFRAEFVAADRVLHVLPARMAEIVVELDHVRFLPLLFREGGEDELRRFSRSRLSPLLGLREQQRRALLKTLSTYFETGASPARTAASLHVHVNTVYYRLERLRALLGPDFASPLRALDLQIALLGERLTGDALEEASNKPVEISSRASVDQGPVHD